MGYGIWRELRPPNGVSVIAEAAHDPQRTSRFGDTNCIATRRVARSFLRHCETFNGKRQFKVD
jgi:hypothetical protein